MKTPRALSLSLISAVACGAAMSLACSSDADTTSGGNDAGKAGTVATAGAGTSIGGSSSTPAGEGGSATGGDTGTAGASPTGGAPSGGVGATGGVSSSTGGASGGTGGASGGSAGIGGTAGASGGAAGSGTVGQFGVMTCQPVFETVCKPKIVFINDDPNGKGKVFTNVVPDVETTMKDITCTACSMLYRSPSEMPKNEQPTTVTVHLQAYGGVAQTGNATIQFDLNYINGYANKSEAITKQEMLGVLQHETVHIYQNYGNNGTGEGMADLVRTRTGYYQRSRWVKGGSWKTPYTSSGFFYSWLTGPCAFHSENYPQHDLDLPYKLNLALAGTRDDASFTAVNNLLMKTFGKDADTLWAQYQSTAF